MKHPLPSNWKPVRLKITKKMKEEAQKDWTIMPKLKTEQLKSKVIFTGTAAELVRFLIEHPEVRKKKITIVKQSG